MLSLIEELLDYSKIEAGKIDLEHRPFVLAALVEDIAELLAPRAQARKLEIAAYVDERLPVEVVGDSARLRQVLLNLAGNAIKFTDAGGVAVIVEPGIWPEEVSFTVRATPGSGSRRRRRRAFFSNSSRPTTGRPAGSEAPGSGSPSPSASSSAWAAASASTARRGPGPRSTSP